LEEATGKRGKVVVTKAEMVRVEMAEEELQSQHRLLLLLQLQSQHRNRLLLNRLKLENIREHLVPTKIPERVFFVFHICLAIYI
jgi:hypothetical protein